MLPLPLGLFEGGDIGKGENAMLWAIRITVFVHFSAFWL